MYPDVDHAIGKVEIDGALAVPSVLFHPLVHLLLEKRIKTQHLCIAQITKQTKHANET